jgi:hypothetical protein
MAGGIDHFEWEKGYFKEALAAPAMTAMVLKKTELGLALFRQRSTYDANRRPGDKRPHNVDKAKATVTWGGAKNDRPIGLIGANAPHSLAVEFGHVQERGAKYRSRAVAEYFGRGIYERASKRIPGQHGLGGDNRTRESVVASLEKM